MPIVEICRVTVAEAVTNLKTLRKQLRDFISHLHQELDSQKQTNEQLREEKVLFQLCIQDIKCLYFYMQ